MRNSYFLFLYNSIVVLCYIALLVLSHFNLIFPFYKAWFSYSLIFLSFLILPRFVIYNVDTNLWAFNLLFLCGAFGILNLHYKLNAIYQLCGYVLCFAVASVLMFVFFRQIFHFKLFTFLSLSAIILIVYESKLINFWVMLALLAVVFGSFGIFLVKTILRNMRKV